MSLTFHTDLGDLKFELFCDQVPKTCYNFLALCASDFYNGCIFHRNIKDFMVQTGDPTGTGKGGKSIFGDYFDDEFVDDLKHDKRGILSMANRGENKNGSQFFIIYGSQPHLDGKNTVFGHLIDGQNTLDLMENQAVNEKNRPITPFTIKNVTIHANPIAAR
ncbi:Peptidyl-prolyl cis-trans isomerase-like 3, partial [Intoshia linei]